MKTRSLLAVAAVMLLGAVSAAPMFAQCCGAPAVATTVVAPAPTTVFYAPTTVQFAQPVTTFYAPRTVFYAPAPMAMPTTTFYAPAPVVVGQPVIVGRPVVIGRGILGQPTLYVPGQPMRNAVRWVTP